MGYFGGSFTDGPVLSLAPQTAHQAIALGKASISSRSPARNRRPFSPRPFATTPMARPSGAGRKRSRDEAEPNLCDDVPEPSPIQPMLDVDNAWMSGTDMVPMEPEVTIAPSAAEVLREAEAKTALQMQQEQQLSGRSYKSQRVERAVAVAATSPGVEFSTAINTPATVSSSANPAGHPIVDDFTLHLGIGWRRVGNEEHIQAAARGWAKFIENHYPISNAIIRLESKGLQSYLVEASEGYFLFDENLRNGRLVSTTGEGALQNLKSNPPVFEGPETMMAAQQPTIPSFSQQIDAGRTHTNVDMEMEVC